MIRSRYLATTVFVVLASSSLCLAQEDPTPVEPAPEPDALPPPEVGPAPEVAPEPEAATDAEQPDTAEIEPLPPPPAPEPSEPLVEQEALQTTPIPGETPPVPAAEESVEVPRSWFARDPIALELGDRLTATWYGVVEVNFIYDTTRSYGDSIGMSLVARGDTYEGTVGRFQASSRSTRIGLALDSAPIGGLTPSAIVEADFAGDQPSSDVGSSERTYYQSPSFRLRHGYFALGSDYIDLLIGQTDDVFGWQNTPSSVTRHTQLRLSHTFGETSPVGLDIAAAAMSPAQRDSQVPDGQAGLRFNVNAVKGIYTRNSIPTARPMSLGVSGVVRQFDVDAFTPPPTQTSNQLVGWGLSIDAVLPVIPADDEFDRGNRLTLSGSFFTGTGVGDLFRLDGGARFPPLPNPARAAPPPEYEANIDEGLVSFDRLGVLNTIDWQGFRIDAQYYLPPSGRVRIAAIYTQAYSKNMHELYPQGGAEIELLTYVADRIRYAEANVYFDITPEARVGLAGIYTQTVYLDGEDPYNLRGKLNGWYFF